MTNSTPTAWRRAKEIFDRVSDLSAAQRDAALDAVCGGDDALRAEVVSLLEAHDAAGEFLEPGATSAGFDPAAVTGDPERFGPYRRRAELGRGGMGTVYLGERVDGAFEQRVAIKVIRRGFDTDAVLARFLAERRILASLDHPGIARLLDGGATEDGRPYFVLEAIDGAPLDLHCERAGLDRDARVRLFLDVCDAVAYAHRRLILHRDLKPANVLVDVHGRPKLLDFGIAKLLEPDRATEVTQLTVAGVNPLTPDFASPEQLLGEPLTTASDVYSLGVMLDRLLTPQRVDEAETRRPSDLELVVEKALADEVALRYATVDALAEDLRRHLAGLPVEAHPPALGYRLKKFLRRHRGASIAATLVALAVAAGVASSLVQARRADAQRRLAERRFEDVRELSRAFIFDVNDGIENLAGATPVREKIVATALTYLDRLARESPAHADATGRALALEAAQGYRRVGDVQGNPRMPNLGNLAGAVASYAKASALVRPWIRRRPDDLEARTLLASLLVRQADVSLLSTGIDDARRSIDEAQALLDATIALAPDAPEPRRLLAQLAARHARVARSDGDFDGAITWARRAVGGAEAVSRTAPRHPEIERDRLVAVNDLSATLGAAGRWDEAETVLRPALPIAERRAAAAPEDFGAARDLSVTLERLGKALNQLGRTAEALPLLRRMVAMDEGRLERDPRNTQSLHDTAASQDQLAQVLWAAEDRPGAIAAFTRSEGVLRRLLEIEPGLRWAEFDLASVVNRRAQIHQELGDLTACLRDAAAALALQDAAVDREPTNNALLYDRAVMRANAADWMRAGGRTAEAAETIDRAVADFGEYLRRVPGEPDARLGSAVSHTLRGELAWRRGARREACGDFAAAEDDWRAYLAGTAGGPAASAKAGGVSNVPEELAGEYAKTTAGTARCAAAAAATVDAGVAVESPL
jgi:tetratricopeptide (TPR) repeat protein